MLWRRRKRINGDAMANDSVYARVLRQRTVLWQGVPFVVGFDYQPYLRASVRRRLTVRALLESIEGELFLVGYCDDTRDERSFNIASVRGDILVERSGRRVTGAHFAGELRGGGLEEEDFPDGRA